MGIHCEINLSKPVDGIYTAGSTVSGTIKYALDKDAMFNKVTVFMTGKGYLSIKRKRKKRSIRSHNREVYIDISNIVPGTDISVIKRGSYETKFTFRLPNDAPSSMKCLKNLPRFVVRCCIDYYVGIKFEKPSFRFDKKFKKSITVVSGITPRLPREPTICSEEKSLTQLFSSKKSTVKIKAAIETSVVAPGKKINFEYEVANNTNIVVKSVKTHLIEIYTFTSSGGKEVTAIDEVPNTDAKTGSIASGEIKNMSIEINVPSDINSIEHSNIVKRDYVVRIIANLPMPYSNAVLDIPVQIGALNLSPMKYDDAPPTYWEAMAEDKSDDSGKDGEENDRLSEDDESRKS